MHASAITTAGVYTSTITLTPSDGSAVISIPVTITVFDFALPTQPALLTAFNLDEAHIAKVYNKSAPPEVPLSAIETLWTHTGCSNPFSATKGEQPLWQTSPDGGAGDMYTYCTLTKAGTASPGQRAVCGTVPNVCILQTLPGGGGAFDPTTRAGHPEFVQWAHWMLANFSLNPGTIYSEPIPFTVDELADMVPLGLNSFNAFPAHADLATNPQIKAYGLLKPRHVPVCRLRACLVLWIIGRGVSAIQRVSGWTRGCAHACGEQVRGGLGRSQTVAVCNHIWLRRVGFT